MIDLVDLADGILDLLAANATIAALNANHVYGPISKATVQTSSLAFGLGLDREPEEGSFYRTVGHAYSRQVRFFVWTWAKGKSPKLADTAGFKLMEVIKIYFRDVANRTLGGKMLDIAVGETDYRADELQSGLFCSTAVFTLVATFGASLL